MKQITQAAAVAVFLLTVITRVGTAQADGEPVALGTYRVLHSRILGEERVLQVHLPKGYESAEAAYPVAYLFYSDWVEGYFAQLVNDLYHLSMDRIPPMILVGVPNTQRYRDLLPWPRSEGRSEEGQADRFLEALQREIIPFVDAEYRTQPFRILVGPQAAAVFGAYMLLESPGTFQAFILNDPCVTDSPERSLCRDLAAFASTPAASGKYVAVSQDAADDRRAAEMLELLRAGFEENAVAGFRWRIEIETDWPFFLAPVAARSALLDLFRDYPFPSVDEVTGWEEIRSHYERISRTLGFTVDPPDLILTQASVRLMDTGEYQAALQVLHHLVEIYPHSLNGPWQLANLHRVMGDTAAAIRYYEECLSRDPNITPARTWLERLRSGR
ncbi:MAG: tetratricopeptide repeat protein [Gemmatimonadota bacterium]|nr:MAG: tetratricopeptide repeat protein [Gemmatimonadota bacterium]